MGRGSDKAADGATVLYGRFQRRQGRQRRSPLVSVTLDPGRGLLHSGNRRVSITPEEAALIKLLWINRGQVLLIEEIGKRVFKDRWALGAVFSYHSAQDLLGSARSKLRDDLGVEAIKPGPKSSDQWDGTQVSGSAKAPPPQLAPEPFLPGSPGLRFP